MYVLVRKVGWVRHAHRSTASEERLCALGIAEPGACFLFLVPGGGRAGVGVDRSVRLAVQSIGHLHV